MEEVAVWRSTARTLRAVTRNGRVSVRERTISEAAERRSLRTWSSGERTTGATRGAASSFFSSERDVWGG